MGQTRNDTPEQRWNKEALAKRRQCPKCQRKSALVKVENLYGRGLVCQWDDCQHVASWHDPALE